MYNKTEQCKTADSLICTSFMVKDNKVDKWFIDSGASSHMTVNKKYLRNVLQSNCSEVVVVDNSRRKIEVSLRLPNGSLSSEVIVKDVQYIPNLCTNLLSVSAMTKQGITVVFDDKGAKIINRNNEVIATASLIDNMYKLDCDVESAFGHRRLGHIGFENLKKMQNGILRANQLFRKFCAQHIRKAFVRAFVASHRIFIGHRISH